MSAGVPLPLCSLDLHPERRYSEQGCWVRDDAAGAARLGVVPQRLGVEDEVVAVRLPDPGAALHAGQPFGSVETLRHSLPVIAPFDARVLAPNPAVLDRPDRLRTDPYGEGFLLDVEGVSADALDALLDRDRAALSYSRLPLRAPFALELRYRPGQRWPERLACTIGGHVVVRARRYPPLAHPLLTPDWQIGDRWSIETQSTAGARTWHSEVSGLGRLAARECWQLRFETDGQPPRLLHIERESFTLLAWDLLAPGTHRRLHRFWNPRELESYLDPQRDSEPIVDLPRLLPEEQAPAQRRVPAEPETGSAEIVERRSFRQGGRELEITMETEIEDAQGRRHTLVSRQLWQDTRPWWTEASRSWDGEVVVAARLRTDTERNGEDRGA